MAYSSEVIAALATLRDSAKGHGMDTATARAFNELDNAGVFRELDEQTGYDIDAQPNDGKQMCEDDGVEMEEFEDAEGKGWECPQCHWIVMANELKS